MKLPKTTKRYCSKCKTHTEQKITTAKRRTAGSAHPLAQFGKKRAEYGKGHGNLGRYGSKPAVGNFKMTGKKGSKKTDLRYQCVECKRITTQAQGIRAKRVEFQ